MGLNPPIGPALTTSWGVGLTRSRRCSICGEEGHDRRSCSKPIPLEIPEPKPFDPWLHYEWEEHEEAMKIVRENPDGMTLEEIGEILGVTRERIRQIELIALDKLRRGREAGACEVVEMKGRLTTYAFALVECEACGEFFIRDGAATLCPACEPEPIPSNMPCLSFGELAFRKVASSRVVIRLRRLRAVEAAREAVLEGFFGCFDEEGEEEGVE